MTVVDQGDAKGRQDAGLPVGGTGRPGEARRDAQLGGCGASVAKLPEGHADGLVRDGSLIRGGVRGQDRASLRKRLPWPGTDQRQQVEYLPGAVAAGGGAASHVIDVKPGY